MLVSLRAHLRGVRYPIRALVIYLSGFIGLNAGMFGIHFIWHGVMPPLDRMMLSGSTLLGVLLLVSWPAFERQRLPRAALMACIASIPPGVVVVLCLRFLSL